MGENENIATCTFTQEYYNYETKKTETFECDQLSLGNKKLCLFHYDEYFKDISHPETKENIIRRLTRRIENSNNNNIPLKCIGYHLPDIKIEKKFTQFVYFNYSKFQEADFYGATFSSDAIFYGATFSSDAIFYGATFSSDAIFSDATFASDAYFYGVTFTSKAHFSGKFENISYFNDVTFENPNKIMFEVEDMSMISFKNTDITRIRFRDNAKWGGEGNFKVIEELWLEEDREKSDNIRRARLGGVLSVYRNLRENYEFRRRYDEAGKFFIREMELKRKYREVKSMSSSSTDYKIKKNNILRRNISLTGIYYNLSRYGEDLLRPTLAGIVIVLLATFFFVCQSNPSLVPTFSSNSIAVKTNNNSSHISNTPKPPSNVADTSAASSHFIGLAQVGNGTHWLKAGERSLADFLPLLPSGEDIKIGLIDYLIKIVGGAVTFGLIAIALRRRFERKYYH